MPTYDFQCNNCEYIFEERLDISNLDKIIPKCPKCKGDSKRLISSPHFILKGSGFYVNDYPKSGRDCKDKKCSKKDNKEIT